MPRRRIPAPDWEPEKRRSDYGTRKITQKDWVGLPFVAGQRFTRYDTLAAWWDPDHLPATHEARKKREGPGPGRGGKRTGLPWPRDWEKRLAAVARIVDQHWVSMGLAESIQPFDKTPRWCRLTGDGLHILGLSWPETPFPTTLKYYEHNDDRRCHSHCINEVRVYLARNGAQAPRHSWISERAIEIQFSQPGPGQTLPHLPDGSITIEEEGRWDLFDTDENWLGYVPLYPGQRVAIEVELNRKSYPRLQKEVFPLLLQQYDYVWYFAESEAKRVVATARERYLATDEERARLRIMSLPEHLPHLYAKWAMTPSSSGRPPLNQP